MTMTFALLLALAGNADSQPAELPKEQKKERVICKRIDATESRMGSKRICKTASQWRAAQGDERSIDKGGRDSTR